MSDDSESDSEDDEPAQSRNAVRSQQPMAVADDDDDLVVADDECADEPAKKQPASNPFMKSQAPVASKTFGGANSKQTAANPFKSNAQKPLSDVKTSGSLGDKISALSSNKRAGLAGFKKQPTQKRAK